MIVSEVSFNRVAARVQSYWNPFEYNPHQAWFAISRSGKSFAIRRGILPLVGMSRTVIMDVKPGGSKTWDDYGNPVTELKSGFGLGPDGTPHYHLLVNSKASAQRFLEMIASEGSCVVVIDDSRRITAPNPDYGLSNTVDQLLTIGAEIGLSVILCANSTTWATSSIRDQCGSTWIGQMPNEDTRKQVVKFAGLPKETVDVIGRMKPRHFLYSDRYDDSGEVRLAITHYSEFANVTDTG